MAINVIKFFDLTNPKRLTPLLVVACVALLNGCGGGDVKEASTMPTSVEAGVFTFEAPAGWTLLSGAKEKSARREIEASTQQMINSYSANAKGDTGTLGINAFKGVRMPNDAGWFMAYTMRIPPQDSYLQTMETEQAEKISWGMEQGIVTRVIERGRKSLDDKEVLWIDLEMRGAARMIGIYYWSKADPGLVGTISATVDPGAYDAVRNELDELLNSLRIQGEL